MANRIEEEILKHFGGHDANNLFHLIGQNDISEGEFAQFNHSNYYDSDGIDKMFTKHKDDFSLLSLNIQSIESKFSSLISYLSYLSSHSFNFDVICLQESWLSDSHDTCLYQIPGYVLISQGKRCCGHGGLIIYLSRKYTYTLRNLYDTSEIWEGLFIDIFGDTLKGKITLGNIYRPPKYNNRNETIEDFSTEFRPIIEKLEKEKSNIFITGDFNIDLLKLQEREKFQDYLDLFMASGFYPQITLPTRFSRKSCSLLDQTFYKSDDKNTIPFSGIIISRISDHLPHFTCLDIKRERTPRKKFVNVYNSSAADINNFCSHIQQRLQAVSFDNDLFSDPNGNYEKMSNILIEAKEQFMPVKVKRVNKYKHKLTPWITSGIIRSIKFRDSLYKKLKTLYPENEEHTRTEINLKTYNYILKKSIRSAKIHYYKYQFEKYKQDTRKTWSTIKFIINKGKNSSDFPSYFMLDNNKITDNRRIADGFNKFFTNIGPTLSKQINTKSSSSYKTFLKEKIMFSFSFKIICQKDTLDTIKNLKSKSSSGFDNISTKLLQTIAPIIASPLTLMINQSLCTGIFPDHLKIAKVVPLYKKDSPHSFDNYRPISLLPAISKVFEKVVYNQLYDYMTQSKLLYESQYGFRKEHSTELASLEFSDRILAHLDKNEIPITIFLDLSKAFDTLDHEILLHKLQYYGVNNIALNWFKSYLTNRHQFVDYNGTCSSKLQLTTGVPQGSILGPLMFIIYMNDIYKVSDKFHSLLYADDTTLDSPLCTFDASSNNNKYDRNTLSTNINYELNLVFEWLCMNKLSLNIKKTKFMIFHNRQRNVESLIPTLTINQHAIERVRDFNFLGLTFDEHMSWNTHIHKISNKISKTLGILSRLKRYLPQSILLMIYNSLVIPYLQYGILCWGFKTNRPFKLQKRAVRLITSSKYNAHTEPLFKNLKILKVSDIFKINLLKFYYKLYNNKVPRYLNNMFSETTPAHDYDTRFRHLGTARRSKTVLGSKCIRYELPMLLHTTPPCIKDKVMSHSPQGYSNYIKTYILNEYTYQCRIPNCYICNQ